MRLFCLYIVLFFLGACSSLDWALSDKNYDATRQKPQWIKHSAQPFNTAVAEIRPRQLHIYDKSVFKLALGLSAANSYFAYVKNVP